MHTKWARALSSPVACTIVWNSGTGLMHNSRVQCTTDRNNMQNPSQELSPPFSLSQHAELLPFKASYRSEVLTAGGCRLFYEILTVMGVDLLLDFAGILQLHSFGTALLEACFSAFSGG